MRKVYREQPASDSIAVEDIELDPTNRDDRPEVLLGSQAIYSDASTRQKLFERLGRHIQPGTIYQSWTLTKRELRAYFDGPAAYVVLCVFLAITGWFFANPMFLQNEASLRSMFNIASFVFLFFVPALTMSSVAEERRAGTLELLLTLPVRDWQVILGKLLSVSLLLLVAIGITLVYALTLTFLGDLDFGATLGGYLGLFLLGFTYGAIGICASSLTRNQIVAFIAGFGIIFLLYLFDKVLDFVPAWMGTILQQLSTDYHFENLMRGVIDSRDVLFYLSMSAFAFLVTMYNLAKRPE